MFILLYRHTLWRWRSQAFYVCNSFSWNGWFINTENELASKKWAISFCCYWCCLLLLLNICVQLFFRHFFRSFICIVVECGRWSCCRCGSTNVNNDKLARHARANDSYRFWNTRHKLTVALCYYCCCCITLATPFNMTTKCVWIWFIYTVALFICASTDFFSFFISLCWSLCIFFY